MSRTNFGKKGLGILFILGAALCFALMNLFVNMTGDLPLFQKVFFRNGLTVIVVGAMLCFQKEHFRIRSKACIPWHFLRSALGLLGVILNFYAIDHIGSISDASILNKLSPFFAILFSVFLLREKPRNPEIIFVLIAFAGAMCVVNPRFDMEVIPALAGFASGACAGFAYTCVRILGMTPAELIGAAKELNALVSALSAASSSDGETQTAAETFAEAPPAAAREDREDALAPVRGIADENIQRMLGKYFS